MDIRRVLFMAVLVAGLVYAWMTSPLTKQFRGGATKRPAAQRALQAGAGQPGVSQPSAAPPASPLSQDELARWRGTHEGAWSRDPFLTAEEEQALLSPKPKATGAAPSAPLPSYTLKAVLISEAGKVATLDGRVVSEGELIGEERLVEIRPDGVVLERAGQRRRISLPGGATPIVETDSRQKGGGG
ncbi:MAG: hypothetical protein HY726_16720 [Candidatus Rokubacteria bacterium]|nr:hypothetical protein [Candidatus Rokubacteria bacterium]